MLLRAAQGMTNETSPQRWGMDSHTVARWRGRFFRRGWPGLEKTLRAAEASPGCATGSPENRRAHHAERSGERHSLERADAGRDDGHQPVDGASRLKANGSSRT